MSSSDVVDVHMATAKGVPSSRCDVRDIHMETAKLATTTKLRRSPLKVWEVELTRTPEVKRKATVAQLCERIVRYFVLFLLWHPRIFRPDFLDYYFQALSYIASRKERRAKFDQDIISRGLSLTSPIYAAELKDYCGRERVILRRRRLKLRLEQFHIIAQVGQGGYGEVFLARKQVSLSFESIRIYRVLNPIYC